MTEMTEMTEEYIKSLENVIKQMLTPIKGISLNLIIESISDRKVLPFNSVDRDHQNLLRLLAKALDTACININIEGITSKRVNEVGNAVEPFIKNALNENEEFKAIIPVTKSGKGKASGYPDIVLIYNEKIYYIECKTYNKENIATTQRSFYLSPSNDFKVTEDAVHLIVSFEVYIDNSSNYKVSKWMIIDAFYLECDVKYEFNSDNKRMYDEKMILQSNEITN